MRELTLPSASTTWYTHIVKRSTQKQNLLEGLRRQIMPSLNSWDRALQKQRSKVGQRFSRFFFRMQIWTVFAPTHKKNVKFPWAALQNMHIFEFVRCVEHFFVFDGHLAVMGNASSRELRGKIRNGPNAINWLSKSVVAPWSRCFDNVDKLIKLHERCPTFELRVRSHAHHDSVPTTKHMADTQRGPPTNTHSISLPRHSRNYPSENFAFFLALRSLWFENLVYVRRAPLATDLPWPFLTKAASLEKFLLGWGKAAFAKLGVAHAWDTARWTSYACKLPNNLPSGREDAVSNSTWWMDCVEKNLFTRCRFAEATVKYETVPQNMCHVTKNLQPLLRRVRIEFLVVLEEEDYIWAISMSANVTVIM